MSCRKVERVLVLGTMPTYDLVVRNGIVVDGTGLPRRRADVAVQDGRIVAVGFVDGDGAREIDAAGKVVAPGIVDVHTHYDPQLTFEPYGTSSCFHGVTTIVAGNCGFSVAPVRPGDGPWLIQLFARVEGMDPSALEGIPFDGFETFPEFLAHIEGRLGINAAFYVGHCAVRRYVMGEDCQTREATAAEVEQMAAVVAEAMGAGAAGFSSTHSPTHVDTADRPVPSRLSSLAELQGAGGRGRSGGDGSIAYLPGSAVGGITPDDEDLLVELSLSARLPVDDPGARRPVEGRRSDRGLGQRQALRRRRHRRRRRRVLDGDDQAVQPDLLPRGRHEALRGRSRRSTACSPRLRRSTSESPCSATPTFRDAIRDSVDNPNRDPDAGPTLPPPHWDVLHVNKVAEAENDKFVGRSLLDIAGELGVHPTDAMIDIALSEDLGVEFVWRTETPEWIEGTRVAQADPHMLVGHVGRRRPPRPRRRRRGALVLPAPLGARVAGLHARGGRPADHGDPRGPVRLHRPRARAARLRRRPLRLRPGDDRPRTARSSSTTSRTAPAGGRRARRAPTPRSSTASPSSSTASSSPTPASPARSSAPTPPLPFWE